MNIAIPIFKSRISPVFDYSTRVLIIDSEGDGDNKRNAVDITGLSNPARVERLKTMGVDILICAGISMPLHRMLNMAGVKVIPGIVGEVEEVINAYHRGTLRKGSFDMPGFCHRRRRRAYAFRFRVPS